MFRWMRSSQLDRTEVVQSVGLKRKRFNCGATYGKWNNIFNKFMVLPNDFSWKQMYENKELKGGKRPLKNGILGSFFLYLFIFNLTKKFSSVSWKWLMAVGWELLRKVDMNFYAMLDWWVCSGCQPNTCGYTIYFIWEGGKIDGRRKYIKFTECKGL